MGRAGTASAPGSWTTRGTRASCRGCAGPTGPGPRARACPGLDPGWSASAPCGRAVSRAPSPAAWPRRAWRSTRRRPTPPWGAGGAGWPTRGCPAPRVRCRPSGSRPSARRERPVPSPCGGRQVARSAGSAAPAAPDRRPAAPAVGPRGARPCRSGRVSEPLARPHRRALRGAAAQDDLWGVARRGPGRRLQGPLARRRPRGGAARPGSTRGGCACARWPPAWPASPPSRRSRASTPDRGPGQASAFATGAPGKRIQLASLAFAARARTFGSWSVARERGAARPLGRGQRAHRDRLGLPGDPARPEGALHHRHRPRADARDRAAPGQARGGRAAHHARPPPADRGRDRLPVPQPRAGEPSPGLRGPTGATVPARSSRWSRAAASAAPPS